MVAADDEKRRQAGHTANRCQKMRQLFRCSTLHNISAMKDEKRVVACSKLQSLFEFPVVPPAVSHEDKAPLFRICRCSLFFKRAERIGIQGGGRGDRVAMEEQQQRNCADTEHQPFEHGSGGKYHFTPFQQLLRNDDIFEGYAAVTDGKRTTDRAEVGSCHESAVIPTFQDKRNRSGKNEFFNNINTPDHNGLPSGKEYVERTDETVRIAGRTILDVRQPRKGGGNTLGTIHGHLADTGTAAGTAPAAEDRSGTRNRDQGDHIPFVEGLTAVAGADRTRRRWSCRHTATAFSTYSKRQIISRRRHKGEADIAVAGDESGGVGVVEERPLGAGSGNRAVGLVTAARGQVESSCATVAGVGRRGRKDAAVSARHACRNSVLGERLEGDVCVGRIGCHVGPAVAVTAVVTLAC